MNSSISQRAQTIENWWLHTYRRLWDCPNSADGGPPAAVQQTILSNVRDLWRQAPNWDTLTELNRRYLQRRLPVCGSYDQPPEHETDTFDNLLRLHDYGVISTNSCPGWVTLEGLERQRSFLYFSIPTRTLATVPGTTCSGAVIALVRGLLDSNQVVRAYVRFQYNEPSRGVRRDPEVLRLMPHGSCDSLPDYGSSEFKDEGWDMKEDGGEIVGFSFEQEQKRHRVEEEWDRDDLGLYEIDWHGSCFFDDDLPIQASWAADPLQICVVARDWNYRQIGQLVERLLVDAGVEPGFMSSN